VRVFGQGVLALHVVQRLQLLLEGTLEDSGELTGSARATTFEQRVLQSDPPVQALAGMPAKVREPGRFVLRRAGPTVGCETLSPDRHPTG
jgi:hypothetical protein